MSGSRRPLVTYKNRPRLRPSVAVFHLPTSPLSDPTEEETSMLQMTRRMRKRSHQATLSAPDLHDREHSAKKSRTQQQNDQDALPQNPNDFSYETPAPPLATSELSMRLSSAAPQESHDRLSPVPHTRKSLFRRISTRNLKENAPTSLLSSDLASPFNSQPNSRHASPSKSKTKSKRPYAKSRTLSEHLTENQTIGVIVDVSEAPRKKAKLRNHSKNPSAPSVMNPSPPHDWLVQAETSLRPSFQPERTITQDGLDFQQRPLESHNSFISDNPVAFSTPVGKRAFQAAFGQSTRPVEPRFSLGRTDGSDTSFAEKCNQLSKSNMDIDMAEAAHQESAPPHRKPRKRIEVHTSADSVFSSMHDIISVTATTAVERPSASAPPTGAQISRDYGSRTMSLTEVVNQSAMEKLSTLAPAFSPSLPIKAHTLVTEGEDTLISDCEDVHMGSSPDPLDLFRLKDIGDVTRLLSDMELANRGSRGHVERTHSLPENKEDSRAGRGHRRRRDTLKASDFLPGGAGAAAVGAKKNTVGRTRSGTVTQSSYQAGMSMGTRVGRDGKLMEIDNGLALSPGDSDDELLVRE